MQAQSLGFFFQHLTVGLIETAEDERGIWCHDADKALHVLKKDVAIDVGQNDVEFSGKSVSQGRTPWYTIIYFL